ncbi:hypothetical protein GGS20DRAFT_590095 [Poronia punctata]|nr:hypothetical protein GGS20DRAFT_590095 [Poronia punctata]
MAPHFWHFIVRPSYMLCSFSLAGYRAADNGCLSSRHYDQRKRQAPLAAMPAPTFEPGIRCTSQHQPGSTSFRLRMTIQKVFIM